MSQKAGESGVAHSKEIGVKLKRINELKAQKREIYQNKDSTEEGTSDLQYERTQLMKKIDEEYNRVDMIDKGLRKLQK